jgi:hypothetical protein
VAPPAAAIVAPEPEPVGVWSRPPVEPVGRGAEGARAGGGGPGDAAQGVDPRRQPGGDRLRALLERKLDAHPNIDCARKAKSATGLARPDFYDWEAEAKKQVEAKTPDLVVVIMGGNDGQDLTPKSGKGKRVGWKSDGWNAAYKARVADFLKEIGVAERKVLWLGLPKSELNSFEQKLAVIRQVQSEAVAELGEAGTYVDTTPFLTDASGALLETATVGKRKDQELREDDGIHFTMAGSEFFADKVYPEVLRVLGLPDAEPEAPAKKKTQVEEGEGPSLAGAAGSPRLPAAWRDLSAVRKRPSWRQRSVRLMATRLHLQWRCR